MMAPLHLAHLDFLVPCNSLRHIQNLDGGTLDKKDILQRPSLPWVFALQAHIDISSVERHGTHHAHPTTAAATPIVSYFTSLLQNLEWSNESWRKLASYLEMAQTSHR
jgi:hypothetical protein